MRLLTAADVHRLLAEHRIAPRKASGQNFVVDPNTVRKVVRDAGVSAGDLVCEIGPGLGSLTLALREVGAVVAAVEIDAGMVRAFRQVLAAEPGTASGVRVIHADALRTDLAEMMEETRTAMGLGGSPAALVANLPYNLATPLVVTALGSGAFGHLFVMVQREVGQRWVAHPGDPLFSGVSVKIAALAEARIAATVSRRAFYPVPNVDSVTVDLRPRPWAAPVDRAALFALVEQGFGQRRKRLRNSLATPDRSPASIEAALERLELAAGSRPEELGLEQWVRLAEALR